MDNFHGRSRAVVMPIPSEHASIKAIRIYGYEKLGVPGEVRTHNLPLRRGMLYPIELLGRVRRGSMLASLHAFVMRAVSTEPVQPDRIKSRCQSMAVERKSEV